MINELEIHGYKSFVSEVFNLKPLTILTGLNGSGKSSIIQSIRMLINSSEDSPYLEGHGDYNELKSKFSPHSAPILMKMTTTHGEVSSLTLDDSIFERHVNGSFIAEYISAERFGPRSTLPICSNRKVTIGEKGEFAVDFFSKFSGCLVNKKMHHSSTVSNHTYVLKSLSC